METLPLELKQRICSYLTTKDLKSLRLTSKDYSVGACHYLLPRIFLFNHPDSCQEVQDIANHPELNQSVTTLVIDTGCFRPQLKYDQWARNFAVVESSTPTSREAKAATSGSGSRAERLSHRDKLHEQWKSYCAHQQESLKKLMLSSISLAFSECPRLKNLILQCYYRQDTEIDGSAGMLKKRQQFNRRVPSSYPERSASKYHWSWESMHFDIWDVLKPVHDAGQSLNSLVLLDADLACPLDWTPPDTPIFRGLKHLRQINSPMNFLRHVVASAPELESFGTFDCWNYKCYTSLPSLMSGPILANLQACSFNRVADTELFAEFLLRQSQTLKQLRIDNGRDYCFDCGRLVTSVKGKLPNLRRIEFRNVGSDHQIYGGWANQYTANDILQDHKHILETGPMEIEDGLWEDYEQIFFPEKTKL
ncbi:hypothetical protein KCU93_g3189, partial [Aureobasidium melanogenum]